MIKFALISLLLATCMAQITPLLSARTIAETLKIMRKDNRGLQPTDDFCSAVVDDWHTFLEPFYGVNFTCDCSDSGSVYNVSCQSDGETCCGDFCGTIQEIGNYTKDETDVPYYEGQVCVTSLAPADLEGEQRCVYLSCAFDATCSCEAEVNGQMCNACDVCIGPLSYAEWYGDVAVDCTNIPGFEDFPTDCRDTTEFFTLAECVNYSAAVCAVLDVDDQETVMEAMFDAFDVGFICNCSDSGSAYNVDCQPDGEICCGDICGTIQNNYSLSYDSLYEEQGCVTFSAPDDIAGEKRCVYFSCDSITCGCEAEMSGQMCSACEICELTENDPYDHVAINCTNIPGFEDFPTDCGSPAKLFDAECIDNSTSTFAPSTTSAAHPKILPPYMATIFIAIFFFLW